MASQKVKDAQASGKFTILFDSGIRTGSDVLKALALGAQAVLSAYYSLLNFRQIPLMLTHTVCMCHSRTPVHVRPGPQRRSGCRSGHQAAAFGYVGYNGPHGVQERRRSSEGDGEEPARCLEAFCVRVVQLEEPDVCQMSVAGVYM